MPPQVKAKRQAGAAAGGVQKLRAAKAPTHKEFRAFIRAVLKEWRAKEQAAGRHVADPILSWDNAPVHGRVREGEWADLNIHADSTHMGVPPYSPDMHSVIELSHALVCKKMKAQIARGEWSREGTGLMPYIKELERLFYSMITPEWAQKTTHRLFIDVLPAIVAIRGDYPPKKLR